MERSGSGVTLAVRVTPKASKSAFAGVIVMPDGSQALAVRVAAAPVDGAANAALIAFLAKQLAVRSSAVTISSGATSRLKIVQIDGDAEQVTRRLQQILGLQCRSD